MIRVESDCCDCALPCIKEACKYYRVVRFYCDKCHEEVEDLFKWHGEEWCLDCIIAELERVEYND